MKRKNYRLSAAVLSVLLCVSLLAACGSGTPAQPADSSAEAQSGAAPSASASASSEASTAEVKKLSLWHINTSGDYPQMMDGFMQRFMDANPGVEVECVALQNDPFKTKLKVAMGAGDAPDIFPTWGGGPLKEYIASGQVTDLTEMMNRNSYKEHFAPAAVDMVTIDGKVWGVPAESAYLGFVFYNKKLFAEHNVEIPKTWDEFIAVCETFKAAGVKPLTLANKTKWPGSITYMYLVDRLGGPEAFENAVNRTGSFEDPVFAKAGEMLQQLVSSDYYVEGFNGLEQDLGQSRPHLYTGKVAMEIMGSMTIYGVMVENPEFYKNDYGLFPFPAIEGGKGDPGNLVGTPSDGLYSVSGQCPYPEEAFEAIKYLIDDEAIAKRTAQGEICPVSKPGKLEDPLFQQIADYLAAAKHVQLWYDQALPPELGELHKDTCQALYGLAMKPVEVNAQMETKAKELLK